jgi:hypothetical protein
MEPDQTPTFEHTLERTNPGEIPAHWKCVKCLRTGNTHEFHGCECIRENTDEDVIGAIENV